MAEIQQAQPADAKQQGTAPAASESARQGEDSEKKRIEDIMSKPIPGPPQVGPEYLFEPDYRRPESTALIVGRFFAELVRVPAIWIRKNLVEPNRGPKYYYYHRKYPRALPIDECYLDDSVCIYEANEEYHRIRKVDRATLAILRYRRDNCLFWHTTDKHYYFPADECRELVETYHREETNYHIKYGDMQHHMGVLQAYNKQKHRMIVDRRRAEMAEAMKGQESEKKPE